MLVSHSFPSNVHVIHIPSIHSIMRGLPALQRHVGHPTKVAWILSETHAT